MLMMMNTGSVPSPAHAHLTTHYTLLESQKIALTLYGENVQSRTDMNSVPGDSVGTRNLNKCRPKYVECMQNHEWAHRFHAGKSQCQRWYEICLSQGFWPGE